MAITLKFFMIKRGLTVEKLALKSNAKTPAELIAYAKTLDVGVTLADEILIRDYFTSLPAINNTPEQNETPDIIVAEGEKSVPEKKKRGKKRVGKNV